MLARIGKETGFDSNRTASECQVLVLLFRIKVFVFKQQSERSEMAGQDESGMDVASGLAPDLAGCCHGDEFATQELH